MGPPLFRRIVHRLRTVEEIGELLWFVFAVIAIASLTLMMVGLGVAGLSKLLGAPLPTVPDDPDRIEWDGLALDTLYGCAGVTVLAGAYRLGRRVFGEAPAATVARVLGAAVLAAVALVGGVSAVEDGDIPSGFVALFFVAGAWRLARGFDDEDAPLPPSFDTPPKLVDEEPTVRVETAVPPRRGPLVVPAARERERPPS